MLTSEREISLFSAPVRGEEIRRKQREEVIGALDCFLGGIDKTFALVLGSLPVENCVASSAEPLVYYAGCFRILPSIAQEDLHSAPSCRHREPIPGRTGRRKVAGCWPVPS